MEKEILEILKSIQLDIKGLKDEVKDLKEGQKIIEKKLDGVVEQTAELLEFRTTVKTKLDELKEVEEVKDLLKTGMESACKLNVPLLAEVSEATNWYDCK